MAASIVVAATAQTPPNDLPRSSITVDGQKLTQADLSALFSSVGTLKARLVQKSPGEMPAYDALVHYAGKSSTLPAQPVIWYSSDNRLATNEADAAAIERATAAAFIAAELDFGLAGPTLQKLYATASTEQARLALAETVAGALAQSSDDERAKAASNVDQVNTKILVGMLRADAYAELRSLGLVAFNNGFLQGRSRKEASSGGGVFETCDVANKDTANWPYRNEPIPPHDGACAVYAGLATANPDAYVTIWGGFTLVPVCGGRTQIVITFDSEDRVKSVTVDGPHDICV
jgi:hypothetical protein